MARDTRWYAFGSAVVQSQGSHDVDLLVVYDHDDIDRARNLGAWIRENSSDASIDLVILSAAEERQIRFIEAETAALVWSSSEPSP